jgi:putative ABC transport system permease protein
MGILKMAWRNLWRRSRRTIVTVGAMTLALFVLILYTGLLEGYLQNMERNILDLEVGDVQVHAGDYRDRPSIYTLISDADALLATLDGQGYRATARLLGGGLVAAGDSSAGASFRGIDVAQDARVSKIGEHLSQGEWLDPADPKGVVLGRRMAQTLDVQLGDELVFLSQATDGSMANDLFKVRGVLLSVGGAVDRGGVFMNAQAFRELLVLPQGVHQIIVRKPGALLLSQAGAEVKAMVGALDARTWRELLPILASMLDSSRGMIYIMFLIIYIAIGIVILNAMLMAVFERIREFGVLKAIGMKPGKVLRLILAESALLTGLAVLVGTLLSLPGLWYLTVHGIDTGKLGGATVSGVALGSNWRAHIAPQTFSGPIMILVIVVLIAVLYPAVKAALIKPIAAMQHR